MSEYGFARASNEVLTARKELANQVVQALQHVGLPAFLDGETTTADRSGAVVSVEPDAETASASVSVGWRCDPGLVQAAVDSLAAGNPGAPIVRCPGMISQHMQGALIKILLSSGVIATLENDSMNPERVLVFGMMSDPDVIKARNELADQVCRELELAGIPAFRQEGNPWDRAGAVVEANPSGDAAGGVFVEWNPHPTLSHAVADSIQSGDFQAKVISHSGAVTSHMRDAIIGILESAGFQADATEDDMRPMAVRVASR